MKKLPRLLIIFLAGLLLVATTDTSAQSKRRKKAIKTLTTKAKRKAQVSRSSRRSSTTASPKLTPEEQHTRDSIRLRHGGTSLLPMMGLSVERIANIEPLTTRFRRGDTTLTKKNIETLYFARPPKQDDGRFFGHIIPAVDSAIRQSQYKEAYALAQKGLWRNPMRIGLLKRACELAIKNGNQKRADLYVWQISELFDLIQHTGDGKTPKTALRITDEEDAMLYETLWLETPKEQIVGQESTTYQGCKLLALVIKNKQGETSKKYYIVGAT